MYEQCLSLFFSPLQKHIWLGLLVKSASFHELILIQLWIAGHQRTSCVTSHRNGTFLAESFSGVTDAAQFLTTMHIK